MDVGFARAEVAPLDGVVEQAEHAVAVVVVVLRGVDAALRGDRMSAARRVLEAEALHLVAQLAQAGGGGRAGQPRAHHQHGELALVAGIDQPQVVAVRQPLAGQAAGGGLAVQLHQRTSPLSTARGSDDVAQGDDPGKGVGEAVAPQVEARMVQAQRLEQAPQAVVQVEAQRHLGGDVEHRHPPHLKAGHHVVVDVAGHEAGVHRPPGEMQQVVDDEQRDDDAAPAHGARSVGGVDARAAGVGDRPRRAADQVELPRGPDVQHDGDQQHHAGAPQQGPPRQLGLAGAAQEFRVGVEHPRTLVELEVARHVPEHEPEQDQAGGGHHRLFAHRRAIDVREPGHARPLRAIRPQAPCPRRRRRRRTRGRGGTAASVACGVRRRAASRHSA